MRTGTAMAVGRLLALIGMGLLLCAATPQNVGHIQVKADPGIKIFLDDTLKGSASPEAGGLILEDVPAGKHTLKAVKDGFQPQEAAITVERGKVVVYTVKPFLPQQTGEMGARLGTLTIQSLPVECTITIPGLGVKDVQKSNDEWTAEGVAEGTYDAEFSARGKTLRYRLTIRASETEKLMVDFAQGKVVDIGAEERRRREADETVTARKDVAPPPAPAAAPPPPSATEQLRGATLRQEQEARRQGEEAARARSAARRASREQDVAQMERADRTISKSEVQAERASPPRAAAGRPTAMRPPATALPDFPWPPPEPSARTELSISLLNVSGKANPSLAWVGAQLVGALKQARYFEYSYYRAPGGFALVARLERMASDGTPLPEEFRFLQPGSQEPFSLAVYVKRLFFAPEGFYRQIVFVASDQPFAATGARIDPKGAAQLLSRGANRLSGDYETMPFTPEHRLSVLIYEFQKGAREGDVATLTPGRLGARTHLDRAGIYPALEKTGR